MNHLDEINHTVEREKPFKREKHNVKCYRIKNTQVIPLKIIVLD